VGAAVHDAFPRDLVYPVFGVELVDVDVLLGKRATLAATPWKFEHGDACPVRLVAFFDPSGTCRVEPGI